MGGGRGTQNSHAPRLIGELGKNSKAITKSQGAVLKIRSARSRISFTRRAHATENNFSSARTVRRTMSEPATAPPVEESAPNATTEATQETVNELAQDEKLLSTEVPRKGKRGRPRKNFPEVLLCGVIVTCYG